MPAPTSLCKIVLRNARDAETASVGAGLILLKTYRGGLGSLLVTSGRIMNSTTGGGKSYSFASGYKVEELAAALDEAEPIWITYTVAQIAILLDTPPVRTAQAHFGRSTYPCVWPVN